MQFVIDRSKWRCGRASTYSSGQGLTQLLNSQGYMCCLGQVAKQLGCGDTDIRGCGTPEVVPKLTGSILSQLGSVPELQGAISLNTNLTNDAISINDDVNLTREERENALIELFKSNGHELTFEGEYTAFHY